MRPSSWPLGALVPLVLCLLGCDGQPAGPPSDLGPRIDLPPAMATASRQPLATPPATGTRPERAAGFWILAVHDGDRPDAPAAAARYCIDDKGSEGQWLTLSHGQDSCSRPQTSRRPDGSVAFTATCVTRRGGRIAMRGVASGDFSQRFKVVLDSTVSGSPVAKANGAHGAIVDGERIGSCPAGWSPGDMDAPGRRKSSQADLMRQLAATPEAAAAQTPPASR